jgi:hypothetical protein
MTQAELRDAYLLGLAEDINEQWKALKDQESYTPVQDTEISEVETSDD